MNSQAPRVRLSSCLALSICLSVSAATADDEIQLSEEEKAKQAAIAEAAAAYAQAVAGSDDSELYTRVLLATIAAGYDAQAQQEIAKLEGQLELQNAKLSALRSLSDSSQRVPPGTPTLASAPPPGFTRSIISGPADFAPSVVPQPSTDGVPDFAPRGPSAGSMPIESKAWRSNIEKVIREFGLRVGPRIFNPNDNEARPVTDLLDCVAIGSFGPGGSSCCSGTLIAPNVVLTAAHCVPCNATQIYVGATANQPSTGRLYGVQQVIPHESYNVPTRYANDLALVVLTDSLDANLVRELATTDEFTAETTYTIVGFGWTDQGNFGIKLEAPVARNAVYTKEFTAGGLGFDTCQGDSGGPIYLAMPSGRFHLAGVTSRGGDCGTGGIYVRVDAYKSWIDGHLNQIRTAGNAPRSAPRYAEEAVSTSP